MFFKSKFQLHCFLETFAFKGKLERKEEKGYLRGLFVHYFTVLSIKQLFSSEPFVLTLKDDFLRKKVNQNHNVCLAFRFAVC